MAGVFFDKLFCWGGGILCAWYAVASLESSFEKEGGGDEEVKHEE